MGYTSTVIKNASWACLMTWKTILPTRQLSLNLAIRSLKYYACYPRLAAQPHPYSLHFLLHYLFHYILTFPPKIQPVSLLEQSHSMIQCAAATKLCILHVHSTNFCIYAFDILTNPFFVYSLLFCWGMSYIFLHNLIFPTGAAIPTTRSWAILSAHSFAILARSVFLISASAAAFPLARLSFVAFVRSCTRGCCRSNPGLNLLPNRWVVLFLVMQEK